MSEITWQPGVTLAEIEQQIIEKAVRFYGNKTRTAQALGIAIRTLDYKLEEYGAKNGRKEEGTSGIQATAGANERYSQNGNEAQAGIHMESAAQTSEKSSLPMQERKEVQGMPSRKVTLDRKK